MNVPLDHLYNYLYGISQHNVLIYRFWPHGSKNLQHLQLLTKPDSDAWVDSFSLPSMICHDQEPLQFELYNNRLENATLAERQLKSLLPTVPTEIKTLFSNSPFKWLRPGNTIDQLVLLHSEQRSAELDKYLAHGFVSVYYWSHAVIARDWYRYASVDPRLEFDPDNITHDFNVYNRAWSGTREYRLKFAKLIVQHELVNHCAMKFNPFDNGQHYTKHVWHNLDLAIGSTDLQNYFEPNNYSSDSSADYNATDYVTAGIDIVLETLYDDQRWHLTEKTLRPIACGKPFILAATPGSLEYLKSYGFKTFTGLIDESYDSIEDPVLRLQAIVMEMKRIAMLSQQQKRQLYQDLDKICQYNKELFFSDVFFDKVINEFRLNLQTAVDHLKSSATANDWKQYLRICAQYPELKNTVIADDLAPNRFKTRKDITEVHKRYQQ
jgi:hypothetical protein